MILFLGLALGHPAATQVRPPDLSTAEFFDQAGMGLRGIEERFRHYWQPHISHSHRRILEAAKLAKGRQRVLVMGAGNCTEIPLEALAREFEQVVLADLDRAGMEQTVAALPADVRGKVEIRVTDVTSFAGPMMERIEAAVRASDSPQEAFEKIGEIYDGLSSIERAPDLPAADLVISSLLLSEIPRYPRAFADRLLRLRYQEGMRSWDRDEEARAGLQEIAIQDHVSLLRRLCRPGGAIYFADTVGRGPLYAKISPAERRAALQSLLPVFYGERVFETAAEGEAGLLFYRSFRARKEQAGLPAPSREQVTALLQRMTRSGDDALSQHAEQDAVLAAETVLGTACLGHFETSAELAILEGLLDRYERSRPEAFETLLRLESVAAEWEKAGLAAQGPSGNWWWIEYPCSVAHREGAFRVKSWILKAIEIVGARQPAAPLQEKGLHRLRYRGSVPLAIPLGCRSGFGRLEVGLIGLPLRLH